MTDQEFRDACKKAEAAGTSMKGIQIYQAIGGCPTCKEFIAFTDFKDELSVKEFCISGMCQSCQDKVFGSEMDAVIPVEEMEEQC